MDELDRQAEIVIKSLDAEGRVAFKAILLNFIKEMREIRASHSKGSLVVDSLIEEKEATKDELDAALRKLSALKSFKEKAIDCLSRLIATDEHNCSYGDDGTCIFHASERPCEHELAHALLAEEARTAQNPDA